MRGRKFYLSPLLSDPAISIELATLDLLNTFCGMKMRGRWTHLLIANISLLHLSSSSSPFLSLSLSFSLCPREHFSLDGRLRLVWSAKHRTVHLLWHWWSKEHLLQQAKGKVNQMAMRKRERARERLERIPFSLSLSLSLVLFLPLLCKVQWSLASTRAFVSAGAGWKERKKKRKERHSFPLSFLCCVSSLSLSLSLWFTLKVKSAQVVAREPRNRGKGLTGGERKCLCYTSHLLCDPDTRLVLGGKEQEKGPVDQITCNGQCHDQLP